MSITTLSSREFNQDTSGAKRATQRGPVFITDRGQPAHVLLSFEDYQRLTSTHATIDQLLAMQKDQDIDFEPPRLRDKMLRPLNLD